MRKKFTRKELGKIKQMDEKIKQSWENFLDPERLRPQLLSASIYISAFKILKDSIIERIRDFFCNGFNKNENIIDDKYQTKVLSLNKSPVYASLEWLKSMDAINENDMEIFTKIKACRNIVAHNLLGIIKSGEFPQDFYDNFRNMTELLRKIEVWWIMNVEIAIDPDLAVQEIDESEIVPGPLMTLRVLCDVALGSDEESRFYYEQFKKGVKA